MDRREKRSRQRLREAMLDLLRETEFDAIRIIDITERADVVISTFYRLYANKLELLQDTLGLLLERVEALQPEPYGWQDVLDLNVAPPVLFLMQLVNDDRRLFQHMLNTPYRSQIFRAIIQIASRKIHDDTPEWKPHEIDLLVSGMIGFFLHWLENDLNYTPEQVALMSHWTMVTGIMVLRGEIEKVTLPHPARLAITPFGDG